jgi:hypothetical protein
MISWYTSQDGHFTGWQVIIPSGVTTKVHAISYQRTFSDLKELWVYFMGPADSIFL